MHALPSFLLRFFARLPLSFLHALGFVLGWTMYGTSPTYRRHFRDNLARAGCGDARTRRAAVAEAGKMLAELPALWFRPHAEVASWVREVRGAEAAEAARARGEALLFLTPHLGSFEITAQYAAQRIPITVLYRAPKIGWLEPLMRAGRERPNVRLVSADLAGVREIFATLGRGGAVGLLPDQVPGEGEGEWCEFFGKPAFTMTLAGRLAARPSVAPFLAYARRLPRGAGFTIVLQPLPRPQPGESAARSLNRALEALIRECPEQYLWGYNRYKTPAGARPAA